MCAACVCATVMKVERDSRLTRHHWPEWENESCDVGVATTYGQFLDDLSGFVAL